jgi:DNA-binding NarL/FixJ family response regulator
LYHAARQAGAAGYLIKDISGEYLFAAISAAARGEPQLHPSVTQRLMQVMPTPGDPRGMLTPTALKAVPRAVLQYTQLSTTACEVRIHTEAAVTTASQPELVTRSLDAN